MKAALWYKSGKIKIEEVPEPIVKDSMVKVKVKYCGICGSDIHEYSVGPIGIPVKQPHPLTGDKAPIIMGHEFSGEVVEVGRGVTKFKAGDRVTVEPLVACGTCTACLRGDYHVCEKRGFHGLSGGGGGFAEYTVFPERFVYMLPDNVSYKQGALTEQLCVALHALNIAKFKIGETAVVFGAGPIGLSTMECLSVAGAKIIIAVQRKSVRQEYAKKAGADIVLDPEAVNVLEEIKKLTMGGADVSFETTGSELCFTNGIMCIRPKGRMVVESVWESNISLNPNLFVSSEKDILGTIASNNNFPQVLSLIEKGKIKPEKYVTEVIKLEDIVEKGFNILTGPEKKKHVKILVEC